MKQRLEIYMTVSEAKHDSRVQIEENGWRIHSISATSNSPYAAIIAIVYEKPEEPSA